MKLQDLFNRIVESKKEAKEIKLMYKDALSNEAHYQDTIDQINKLKVQKKLIEDEVKQDFTHEFNKLDTLKMDIQNDTMLLSDATLTKFMKGETVEIVDQYENKYEPNFNVKFKKQ